MENVYNLFVLNYSKQQYFFILYNMIDFCCKRSMIEIRR